MQADKPYRVIFSLPERTAFVVQLNRQGIQEVLSRKGDAAQSATRGVTPSLR
jgi:hypothetical protein